MFWRPRFSNECRGRHIAPGEEVLDAPNLCFRFTRHRLLEGERKLEAARRLTRPVLFEVG